MCVQLCASTYARLYNLCGCYYSDSTTYSCTLIHGRGVGLGGGEAFWQHKLTFAISIIDFMQTCRVPAYINFLCITSVTSWLVRSGYTAVVLRDLCFTSVRHFSCKRESSPNAAGEIPPQIKVATSRRNLSCMIRNCISSCTVQHCLPTSEMHKFETHWQQEYTFQGSACHMHLHEQCFLGSA